MCVKVLNEVVVDRGPSSYLSNVDLYLDGRLITSVQGDGEFIVTWCHCLSRLVAFLSKSKQRLQTVHLKQGNGGNIPSLSHRSDCVHAYRQHSVCGCCRSLHDPPQRTRYHGHPHLPTLTILQAHRRTRWGGAHGKGERGESAPSIMNCFKMWFSTFLNDQTRIHLLYPFPLAAFNLSCWTCISIVSVLWTC